MRYIMMFSKYVWLICSACWTAAGIAMGDELMLIIAAVCLATSWLAGRVEKDS